MAYIIGLINNALKINTRLNIKTEIKRGSLSLLIFFIIYWLIIGFSSGIPDLHNYQLFYSYAENGVRYSGVEIGYYFFMRLCALIKLDYSGFFKLYTFVALFLIVKSVSDYTEKKTVGLLMLLFFPYFHLVVAVRNLMGGAISLYAVRYLFDENNSKYKNIKYILLIFLASSFHTSALFYFVFLLAKKNMSFVRHFTILLLLFACMITIIGNPIFAQLYQVIPKLEVYLGKGLDGTRDITKVFLLTYFILKLFICEILFQYQKNRDDSTLYGINVLTTIILPFALFNMNFMRVEYYMIPVFIVYGLNAHYIKNYDYSTIHAYYLAKVFFYLYFLMSGFILLYLFSYESVVISVLKNNDIFGRLFLQ